MFVIVVRSPSHVWLFVTPQTVALQASLSLIISRSLPKFMATESVMSFSVTLFSFCLQSFPASGSFPMSQLFTSGGQSTGASASVLPMNLQGWFPLGLTGLIALLFMELSRVFSSTTVGKYQFFSAQPSLWSNSHSYMTSGKTIALTIQWQKKDQTYTSYSEVKSLSRVRLFVTPWTVACTKLLRPWDFPGKSTGVGCHFLLQGIFLTQGSNPGLLHCQEGSLPLSHLGSPVESWVSSYCWCYCYSISLLA